MLRSWAAQGRLPSVGAERRPVHSHRRGAGRQNLPLPHPRRKALARHASARPPSAGLARSKRPSSTCRIGRTTPPGLAPPRSRSRAALTCD